MANPTFTYDPASRTPLSQVRLLIPDTDSSTFIFTDDEINAFLYLESSQSLYVSPQANPYAFPTTSTYIPQVFSPYMAAATALNVLASSKARLAVVVQLLDVKLDPKAVSAALMAVAAEYRQREQDRGHFAIAEQICTQFQARERVWAQWLRLYAS